MTASMHEELFAAFREDAEALTQLEEVLADPGEPFYEMSVASDALAVAMRRYLLRRAQAEQHPTAATAG